MMRACLLATLTFLFSSGTAAAQTVLCSEDLVVETWGRALDAYDGGDEQTTAAEIDALILACGGDPITYLPRVLRAELALGAGEIGRAAELLAPLPETYDSFVSAHAGWLRMIAFKHLGDEESFRRTRSGILAAADTFLSDEAGGAAGRSIETWTTEREQIRAYETRLVQAGGALYRRYIFIIEPHSVALPRSVTITNSAATSLLSEFGLDSDREENEPTALAVDGYECGTHFTLDWIDSEREDDGPTVSYETAKKAIQPMLGKEMVSSPPIADGEPIETCSMSGYITPVEAG